MEHQVLQALGLQFAMVSSEEVRRRLSIPQASSTINFMVQLLRSPILVLIGA
jgi:hypothetical protein